MSAATFLTFLPQPGIEPARIVDAAKNGYRLTIIRTMLPKSGDVLRAKETIDRFLGDILQIVPEVDTAVAVIVWNNGITTPKD